MTFFWYIANRALETVCDDCATGNGTKRRSIDLGAGICGGAIFAWTETGRVARIERETIELNFAFDT